MEKVGAYTERVTASGEWQGGDVQSGLRATPMKAEYFNMLQRELLAVVQGAGIDLDKEDDGQLLQAIRRIRGGAAANFGTWAWSQSLNGNPGQAHVALNNVDATLATELRISEVSADAEDFTQSLSLLRAGDTISFQDQSAAMSYRFRVIGAEVDNGAYRSVPVRFLSGSGGLPDESAVVSVLLTLAGASDDGLPVGAIISVPKAIVPTGYLELDGGSYSIAAYPDLAAYLGTTFNKGNEEAGFFRLPETRGEFLRGWSHGRDADAGRSLGSWQNFELQEHSHVQRGLNNIASGAGGAGGLNVAGTGQNGTPTGTTGGAETRPRNIAVMWCIKAWNAPVNQAATDVAALKALAKQATETAIGVMRIATAAEVQTGANDEAAVTPLKLRQQKNQCSAWVNFNGTGTVAIRDSHNVSSIVDSGVGMYGINLLGLSNPNYAAVCTCSLTGNSGLVSISEQLATSISVRTAYLSSTQPGTALDASIVNISIFGGR